MNCETVKLVIRDQVAILSLNRPQRMNAVIERMYEEIGAVLDACEKDSEVRTLILTGSAWKRPEGEKQAFCAGADLKEHGEGKRTPELKRAYIELAHSTTKRLREFPKPVVVAVNGPARGAGAELALNGDLLLMANTATLAFPETGLGTFVGGGVTWLLPKLVGESRAKELVFTGRVIGGEEAVGLGLAIESVPLEGLMDRAMELALAISEKAPLSIAAAKKLIGRERAGGLAQALDEETEQILECMKTEDWQEGVDSFSEKRKSHFTGR